MRPTDYDKLKRGVIDHKDRGYSALSYVWGDPAAVCWIKCNGYNIRIGHSLYSALKDIRSWKESKILWVDNFQLAKIGEIYENASRVIAWLGQGTEDCDIAISFLKQVDAIISSQSKGKRGQKSNRDISGTQRQQTISIHFRFAR